MKEKIAKAYSAKGNFYRHKKLWNPYSKSPGFDGIPAEFCKFSGMIFQTVC